MNFVEEYYKKLKKLIDSIEVTGKNGNKICFDDGIDKAMELIMERASAGKKLIFIGNGASSTISSHQAVDFWKNGRMRAIAFNDAALLTCISNDIGYENVFEKPIEMFADDGDILIAISSSGKSKNILMGVQAAKNKNCEIITLSDFDCENLLRKSGGINFYVPSCDYGHIEILHHSICHCILDCIIKIKK